MASILSRPQCVNFKPLPIVSLQESIVQLTKEMKFAKENHALRTQQAAEEKERILRAKLRAKQD